MLSYQSELKNDNHEVLELAIDGDHVNLTARNENGRIDSNIHLTHEEFDALVSLVVNFRTAQAAMRDGRPVVTNPRTYQDLSQPL